MPQIALHLSSLACSLGCCALLAGCGQTGDLYLPKQAAPKPGAAAAAAPGKPGVPPASAPVPSTPPASQQ